MKFRYQVLCALPVVMLAYTLLPVPAQAQFSQQAKLVGTGALGPASQGFSVSLSRDGNTAIVGGSSDDNVGAAWVYTRSRRVWSQQEKLVGTGAIGGVKRSSAGSGALACVPYGYTLERQSGETSNPSHLG